MTASFRQIFTEWAITALKKNHCLTQLTRLDETRTQINREEGATKETFSWRGVEWITFVKLWFCSQMASALSSPIGALAVPRRGMVLMRKTGGDTDIHWQNSDSRREQHTPECLRARREQTAFRGPCTPCPNGSQARCHPGVAAFAVDGACSTDGH